MLASMSSVDGWLEGLLHGQASVGLVLLVSLALGLRHATDPDHLAAVTTLIASEEERSRVGRAGLMGLLWGAGHGTTLLLLGLPLLLLGRYLPEAVQQAAEVAIGGIIAALALRLLYRWRRGLFHAHTHDHGSEVHRHLHSHAEESSHGHAHTTPLRTPLSSYGVGLVHGIGGSGGLTLLLLSTISDRGEAVAALLIFAAGTAVSMALLSTTFGLAISGSPIARNFGRVAPVLGVMGVAFGAWYALGALEVVSYPF
jgi:ABC-type nickel/cobalt efflux system permease component RcnA